jgi:hypothetical protein
MYFIVLPISAYHTRIALPRVAELIRAVSIHMCLVGLPISLVVRKYSLTLCLPDKLSPQLKRPAVS